MRVQDADRPAPDLLRVSMFGPLRVVTPAGALAVRDFPGVKPRQLLEVLLCHRGHAVSKSRLAELLWDESLPRDHVATLETYVSVLRRALAPGQPASRSVVVTEHGGYRVSLDRVEADLDLFDSHRRSALDAAEPAAALAALRRALHLVSGPVLEHEPYAAWTQCLRAEYEERHVATLVEAGRLALVLGEAPAALELARQAVTLHPLDESGYQVLMTAAYALQRQDEALQAFDQCRRLLVEELGVDPVPATTALHLGILHHDPLSQLVPELGAGPARGAVTGTAPARDAAPGLLGREHELAVLQEAAERARAGRLTVALVTGAGGMGKTALVERLVQTCGLPLAVNRCSDLETCFPYLALALALQPLVPGTEHLAGRAGPDDAAARLRTMEDVACSLRDRPPLVLWLDDASWADRETVATLAYLQRRCPTVPVLVVLTAGRSPAALAALHGLRPDVRVDLLPLTEDCVDALGHDGLFALTGGHPLYLDAWLRARRSAAADLFPPDLHERVLLSVQEAGAHACRLLGTAAALEQDAFAPALLARLLDVGLDSVVDQLDALVEAGLLRWTGDELAFSVPAVREVFATTLSPPRRAVLRERARTGWAEHLPWQRSALCRTTAPDLPVRPTPAVVRLLPPARVPL